MEAPVDLHVVATAGHVDHGKSALISALTGMDPDRLAEEKRRGLTIDLGFAWFTLPSGREVGFVDVPGHERFVRNMLAGVGPIRAVLFVVAADEGWKPQSEEHLAILDVLGVHGAVVALTKSDLAETELLGERRDEVSRRLAGTRLEGSPILSCSAATGAGIEDITLAIDRMLATLPAPNRDGRPRQYLDRAFTIKGAGTVVTGTLTGGPLFTGQEAEILPSGHRARIRGLQSHKRSLPSARPVSRVAVNLAGTPRSGLERGDVLTLPGLWRATTTFEAWIRPVRGLDRPLTSRGAYKLYVGSAERDATLRIYGGAEVSPGGEAFARIRLSRGAVLDFHDLFVLREAGRQQTVAGGVVLDTDPPLRPGPNAEGRLRARRDADRADLGWLVVRDRGAIRAGDLTLVTGSPAGDAAARGALRLDAWMADPELAHHAAERLTERLTAHHSAHPLEPGVDISDVRITLADLHPAFSDPGLVDGLLSLLRDEGRVTRVANTVALASHRPSTEGREDADRLVMAVRVAEPTPPTIRELVAAGFQPELVRAVCADGRLVRVSNDIVISPELLSRAEDVIRTKSGGSGVTVSAFREALGTSRKYALPLLEYFDARGLTVRRGDARVLRR
jgi:selenocysteine-specific elongation factor